MGNNDALMVFVENNIGFIIMAMCFLVAAMIRLIIIFILDKGGS